MIDSDRMVSDIQVPPFARAGVFDYMTVMKTSGFLASIILFSPLLVFGKTAPARDFLNSSADQKKVEFYWSKPEGKGPFPTLLMIHPEQDSKIGGESFVKMGQFDYWNKKGFLVAAVSQPGYGGSEGPADFCGPRTQQATRDVIARLRTMADVDARHIFVYGGSRGAVVGSLLATQESNLTGVILKSGVYDFIEWSDSRPWYDMIKLTMLWEIGWLNEQKLKDRSAIYQADHIKAPVLVIHGVKDDRAPMVIAEKFVARIKGSGGSPQLIKVDSEHIIPMPQIAESMEKFMREHW